jgi:hypothetical protein
VAGRGRRAGEVTMSSTAYEPGRQRDPTPANPVAQAPSIDLMTTARAG